MITTLNKIREHSPCTNGWAKLLKTLNKTKADDEEVSIIQVLNSNGLDDALWTLRAVTGRDKEIRLFAVWCARQVEHLNTDPRVKQCNDVSERFTNGEATQEELAAAEAAAGAAAAAWAAGAAAEAAAWAAGAAAEAAAWAAGAAAWAAAEAAAWAAGAAWEAVREAAGAAGADQEKELRRICAKCESEK